MSAVPVPLLSQTPLLASESSGPAASQRRSYLVFVRAGRESSHQRLIAEDPARNWDCCVNWYGTPGPDCDAEYYVWDDGTHAATCNKLEGFVRFWRSRGQMSGYKYILLLDDDVYFRPGEISRFFELCDSYGTYLAQPALRWFTNTTLNALVCNPVCVLRRVSFIEAMAPCFSAEALERLLPTFTWTRSVWGIDWAWSCLLEREQPLHVIDAICIEHTRTGDGRPTVFYRTLRAMGIDPREDLKRIQRMFPLFRGSRTLPDGHVFRLGVPSVLAPLLMRVLERFKVIVRVRKKLGRNWRHWRARAEDWARGVRQGAA